MAKKCYRNIVRRESRDGVDQITTLPDDVLVRILSFLPTEEALIASILSKRWKSLWISIPVLDFDFARFSEKFNALSLDDTKRRFLDFVEHVLFLHALEPLQNLRLAFDISEFDDYISKASLLVKFAMRSKCLTMDLDFSSQIVMEPQFLDGYDVLSYTLPPCFFPHQSVSQLQLTRCKFVPSFYKSFASFTIVKLTSVVLQKDSVYDLVSKCPCLEELHLNHCQIPSSFFELIIPESNLKCLVVQYCYGNGQLSFEHASIQIPTLLKFKFVGSFASGYLSIWDSENLMEAEIDIFNRPHSEHKLLCKLLKDLCNVKSLTLFSCNLEVLNTNGGIGLLTPLYNLKHLTVKLGHADKELPGLMCLLRSSPYLETLSIDFRLKYESEDEILSAVYNVDGEAVLQPHLVPSECVSHLIKIKIENFQGVKAEMEFVKFILLTSFRLKEMVICIHSRYYDLKSYIRKELHKTLKKTKAETIDSLLACTRASPDAKILLE